MQQIRDISKQLGMTDQGQMLMAQVLMLPGVVPESGSPPSHRLRHDWAIIEKVLQEALDRLQGDHRKDRRQRDGRRTAVSHQDAIARASRHVIRKMVPQVVTTLPRSAYDPHRKRF